MKDSRVVTALKNKAAFSHGSGENCYGGRWGRKLMKVSSFMEEKKIKHIRLRLRWLQGTAFESRDSCSAYEEAIAATES